MTWRGEVRRTTLRGASLCAPNAFWTCLDFHPCYQPFGIDFSYNLCHKFRIGGENASSMFEMRIKSLRVRKVKCNRQFSAQTKLEPMLSIISNRFMIESSQQFEKWWREKLFTVARWRGQNCGRAIQCTPDGFWQGLNFPRCYSTFWIDWCWDISHIFHIGGATSLQTFETWRVTLDDG